MLRPDFATLIFLKALSRKVTEKASPFSELTFSVTLWHKGFHKIEVEKSGRFFSLRVIALQFVHAIARFFLL